MTDELKELQTLLEEGFITQDEFQLVKRSVIEGAAKGPSAVEFQDLKIQNELNQLEVEWIQEREQYLLTDRRVGRHAPKKLGDYFYASIYIAGLIVLFAIIQISSTIKPRPTFTHLLPVGLIALIGLMSAWISEWRLAVRFEAAQLKYNQRRESLLQQRSDNEIRLPQA